MKYLGAKQSNKNANSSKKIELSENSKIAKNLNFRDIIQRNNSSEIFKTKNKYDAYDNNLRGSL